MRVVFTVLNGRIAGGQVICLRILEAARRRGDEVALVSPTRGELTARLEREGVPVFILPLDRTFHLHRAWQLARLVKRQRADLVHCHAFIPGAILARLAGALARVPVICHLHAFPTFSANPIVLSLQLMLERRTARFGRFIAVSPVVRDAYVAHGIPPERVAVVENGIELPDIPQALEAPDARKAPESVVVGYAGRLSRHKGLDDLVRAVADVKRRGAAIRLRIAGEEHDGNGSYPLALQRLIADEQVADRVELVGFVPNILDWMRSIDVFVLPSHLEALPVSILEAMAVSRPVIATSVGSVPDVVVDGETGRLVPPHEPRRLADAIAELACSADLRVRMGEAGRRRVAERFSEERMLNAIWSAYREAAA